MLEDGDGIDLVECFDPRNNQWKELSPMLIARSGSAACILNGYIYVIGKSLSVNSMNVSYQLLYISCRPNHHSPPTHPHPRSNYSLN